MSEEVKEVIYKKIHKIETSRDYCTYHEALNLVKNPEVEYVKFDKLTLKGVSNEIL